VVDEVSFVAPVPKRFLTSVEAAAVLMISPVTVREWARKGLLPSVSTIGGHRRFLRDSLRDFAKAHGIPLEDALTAPEVAPLAVMIVDDDPVFASYIRETILSAEPNARIKLAADGFEAGQLSESIRPRLVTIDIHMPRVDGIELCRRLRASPTTASARLVVLSGALTADNITAARDAGADAWLDKGAPRVEILRVLGLAQPERRSASASDEGVPPGGTTV